MPQYELPEQIRRRRQRNIGIAVGAGVGVFLGTVLILFAYRSATEPEVGKDHCPPADAIPMQVALIIDATEPYDEKQKFFIEDYLSGFILDLPVYSRLAVFVVTSSGDALVQPQFQQCRPKAPDEFSALWDPRLKLGALWEEFNQTVQAVFSEALNASAASESPIMSVMQSAGLLVAPGPGAGARFVLVSDFLENTPAYSHYADGPPSFEKFVGTPRAEKLKVNLAGVSVVMLYARREGMEGVQGNAHRSFWERYIAWQGGSLDLFEPIPSAAPSVG